MRNTNAQRYFQFTPKQLSYHDTPDTPAKGTFEYSPSSCSSQIVRGLRLDICWLKEGVNYCKQQFSFSQYSRLGSACYGVVALDPHPCSSRGTRTTSSC